MDLIRGCLLIGLDWTWTGLLVCNEVEQAHLRNEPLIYERLAGMLKARRSKGALTSPLTGTKALRMLRQSVEQFPLVVGQLFQVDLMS